MIPNKQSPTRTPPNPLRLPAFLPVCPPPPNHDPLRASRPPRYLLFHHLTCRPPLQPHKARHPTAAVLPLKKADVPNILTYSRVAAIPLLATVGLLSPFRAQYALLGLIFSAASLTDLLDGYLARRWDVISPIGIFLDPVADKLIVAVALVLLSARFPTVPIISSAVTIITREIFVSALREWMAIRQKSAVVKVSIFGKLKTATQLISLSILLSLPKLSSWYAHSAVFLLLVSTFLAVFSAIDYIRAAFASLSQP